MKGRFRPPVVVAQQKTRVKKTLRLWCVKATAALLLLSFATISLRGNWPVALLLVSGGIGLWGFFEARRKRQDRSVVLQEVDTMDDGRFLAYVAELLKAQGYVVHKANRSPDSQTDLLLTRSKTHFLCRLQRQPGWVGKNAIVGALAAMHTQGCTRAMVVTNQRFTHPARSFAHQNDCVLIDRDALASLVIQYRQGHRVLAFHREETAGIRRRK